MANEWITAKIQDVAERVAMGPFGSSIKVETFVRQGIPVISGQHLRGCRLRDFDYNFISLEHADKLANANVRRGDVIFTHAGNIGQVAYIPKSSMYDRYVISQRQFYLRPNLDKVLPEFIAYYFTSSEGQHKLLANTSSSGVPSIAQPVTYLRTIEIQLPPLREQHAISDIIGTLDDKIELNQQMNDTLESLSRELFKSCFVNFDPVRAKAEGRKPGIPKPFADLFPDVLVDSEIGEIPKGWQVGKVSDVCDAIYSGGTPSTQNPDYWDGDIPWLSSGETRQKFITGTERQITSAGVSNSSTRMAPALSTVIASAGQGNTRGQTSLLMIDSYINQSVVVLTANPKASSPYHLFFDLERRYEEFRRISDAHSSRGSLTTKLLAGLDIVMPPHQLIQYFDSSVSVYVERVVGNLRQSHTLSALRDTLLPRLISGELRVKDAARIVGRHV